MDTNYELVKEVITFYDNEGMMDDFLSEFESPFNTNLSIDSVIKFSGFASNENFVAYVKEKQEKINKY